MRVEHVEMAEENLPRQPGLRMHRDNLATISSWLARLLLSGQVTFGMLTPGFPTNGSPFKSACAFRPPAGCSVVCVRVGIGLPPALSLTKVCPVRHDRLK